MVTTAETYSYGGFGFGVDLDSLLSEALQVHARIPSVSHLGATTTDQNKRLADIINRRILAFLRAVPDVGQSVTDSFTTVAGQSNYSIPTDLQGLAIGRMVYANTGSDPVNDLREIKYITQQQLWNLPIPVRSGILTQQFPDNWTYVRGSNNRTQLTGTLAVTLNNATVTGTNTLFTTELSSGDEVSIYGQVYTVGTITNDTSMILTSGWALPSQSGVTGYKVEGVAFTSINLYPWPAVDDIEIVWSYQIKPPLITYTDVQNRATVPYMIDCVPMEFQNILATSVAIDILTTEQMWERKQFLMQQLPGLIDEAQRVMSAPEAAENGAAQQSGESSNLVDDDAIFAGMPGTYYG